MKKIMKPGNNYFIINVDEPYAKIIYEVIKAGQIAKNDWPEGDISFDEWVKQTFPKKQLTRRTQDEIVARYRERRGEDQFCFECGIYLAYMDFEHSKQFQDTITTEEVWCSRCAKKEPRTTMIEYMPFAWEKANNFRGLSAARSILHYVAWLWLDGEDKLSTEIKGYSYYGKPQLVKICDYLGIDSSKYDDGIREN